MLHIATLLPAPPGVSIADEEALWLQIVWPFLETFGYSVSQCVRIGQEVGRLENDWPRFSLQLYHTSPSARMPADMLLVLEPNRVSPGDLLDRCIDWARTLPVMPPLVAMAHRQRNGFVLAAFHTVTRMPLGVAFPSPSALKSLAAGLRRIAAAEMQSFADLGALQSSLLQARLRQDGAAMSELLAELAELYQVQGRYTEARQALLELLELHRSSEGESYVARTAKDLGQVALLLEQWDEAETHLMEALDIFRGQGDRAAVAATLVDLGGVHLSRKAYDAAEQMLQEALSINRALNDSEGQGAVLNNMAQLHLTLGDYERAAQCLEQSLEITRALGAPREELITLYNLAVTYGFLGRTAQATRLIREVRRLSDALEAPTAGE